MYVGLSNGELLAVQSQLDARAGDLTIDYLAGAMSRADFDDAIERLAVAWTAAENERQGIPAVWVAMNGKRGA